MKKIIFGSFLAITVSASAFAKTADVKSVNLNYPTQTVATTFVSNHGQSYVMYYNADEDRWYCTLAGTAATIGAIKLGADPKAAAAIGASVTAGCTAIFGGKPVKAAVTAA